MDYYLKLAVVSLAMMAVCSLVNTVVNTVFTEMCRKRDERWEKRCVRMDAHVIRRDTVGNKPVAVTLPINVTKEMLLRLEEIRALLAMGFGEPEAQKTGDAHIAEPRKEPT